MADRAQISLDIGGAVAHLRDIHRRFGLGRDLTIEQVQWLEVAIGGYLDALDDGGEASLDRAMGLRGRGGVSLSRFMAIDLRDRLLRKLFREIPEWKILIPGSAARAMVASFRRYESDRWPRERDHSAPLTDVEPFSTWWRIRSGNVAMPGVRQLREILKVEMPRGV